MKSKRNQHGPASAEYLTKQETSAYLGDISIRRVDELIKEQNWVTRKEKREGWRNPNRVIRYEDVKAYKASQSAPTIDVGGPGKTLAKREKPRRGSVPPVLEVLVKILERMAPQPAVTPERYLTLEEAAAYIGLPRTYLEKQCREGRLAFLWTGAAKGGRIRRVRIMDLQGIGNTPLARGVGG